jgi:cytochrome c
LTLSLNHGSRPKALSFGSKYCIFKPFKLYKTLINLFCKTLSTFLVMLVVVNFGYSQNKKVLIFSKTAGYRHGSIEAGQTFFKKIASEVNLDFTFSEDAAVVNEENLKQFSAVVFLNTTGDILDERQQSDFERYIQAGGGFMGIHAAADTEYGWPWYNKLVGAWFASHPGGSVSNIQDGKMTVHDQTHPATKHLPSTFTRDDEFYDFQSVQKDAIKVLISVDEKSYQQGKMGDWHPMAWYQDFDGGKAFYTNFGHVESTFEDEDAMQKHLSEGLKSVLADGLDYSKSYSMRAPEENRFVRTVLASNLNEPTELAAMPNGKVILVERRGDVKVWIPSKEEFKTVASLDVFSEYEYGLMGVGLDPNFNRNNWVYVYYTPNTDTHNEQFLSRFTYNQDKDELDISSEKIMLKVGVKGDGCCHTGGSIDWDSKGNLFLSTGDDTNPFASDGFGPIDFREERAGWDALSSAGNTNDLRGKILRITPTIDGSYIIPQGNLYAEGIPNTRPEIFVMGCRNPYRIAVDKRTDYLYWGDVGPDAGKTKEGRGSEGLVEFNQAKEPGFYGWPIIVGNNRPYNRYNFETKESGEKYSIQKPENDSPHNTGLKMLPPAREPLLYYGYGLSEEHPLLGQGGCNPMAGPIYYSDDYLENENKFPSYFDGKFFAFEWIRGWIMVMTMDENGKYRSMEKFMPSTNFNHPMDITFSHDGIMYLLEYGPKWSSQNEEATLSRIQYNANNRPPLAKISVNKAVGKTPLKATFSSEGTIDYDGDDITYAWDFDGGAKNSTTQNPTATFKKPGIYNVTLEVKDGLGSKGKKSMIVKVGNEVPELEITINGNKSFYLGDENIAYEIDVRDSEDGVIGNGIKSEDVVVSIDYLEGYDKNAVVIGHQRNIANANGRKLIDKSDCKACHQLATKSIGPNFKDIATKYQKTKKNIADLADKIINGGGGVWGETAMAAHPSLEKNNVESMVRYILSVNDEKASLPTIGTYVAKEHEGKKSGAYVIQATYEDKGGDIVGPQSGTATMALRSALLPATAFDKDLGTMNVDVPNVGELIVASNKTWIMFEKLDLTGIQNAEVLAFSMKGQTVGGTAEFRLGSPEGKIIGSVVIPESSIAPLKMSFNEKFDVSDVYVTFKNDEIEGKPLFGLKSIEFKK